MNAQLIHLTDVENGFDDPRAIARLAGAVAERRTPSTVVCCSGDNTAPGALSLATTGGHVERFYELIGADVETFGNHDFDYGPEPIRGLVARAAPRWVCANLRSPSGEPFAAEEGCVPRTVLTVAGTRIGIVGVTTEELETYCPKLSGYRSTDPVEAAQAGVSALRGDGVDHVVALAHRSETSDLAELDIDVILAGHEHSPLCERRTGTLVVRPDAGGTQYATVSLGEGAPTATLHDVSVSAPAEPAYEAAIRRQMDEAGLFDPVADLERPLSLSERDRKAGESRLGNFITDAYRHETGADVAVQVGGSRSDGALEGTVTAGDLVGMVPFDNELAVLSLSGERLRAVFRELSLAHLPDAPAWEFGHVSGARLRWDDRRTRLERAWVGGTPLDSDGRYTLAVADYHLGSDEVFTTVDEGDVERVAGRAPDALVEYARRYGVAPTLEGRIERPALGK